MVERPESHPRTSLINPRDRRNSPVPRSTHLAALMLILCTTTNGRGQAPTAKPDDSSVPPPVQLTKEQDHRRTLDLLHIDSLRRGADGNNAKAANAANYDESKANP